MLDDYWVRMNQTQTDDRGKNRKLESLYRIAIAISKLKLKDQVDDEDATETMELYNIILLHFSRVVSVSQSPKQIAYDTCIDILRDMSPNLISLTELVTMACNREGKEQMKDYIGDDLNMRSNWKLRAVHDQLVSNENVKIVKTKPIVLEWEEKNQTMVKASKEACDECDDVMRHKNGVGQKMEKMSTKQMEKNTPHTPPLTSSHTSHSKYDHLVETKDLPNLGRTVFWCKESP